MTLSPFALRWCRLSVLWCGCCLLLLLLSSLPSPCLSVDRSKFRTCKDTAFCRRNRHQPSAAAHQSDQAAAAHPPHRYEIQASSVAVDAASSASLTASLVHRLHPLRPPLSLRLSILRDGVVHLRVVEAAPLHPRWVVQDIVQAAATAPHPSAAFSVEQQRASASWTQRNAANASLSHRMELQVAYSPLSVTLSVDGVASAVFNHRGLFEYEQYRERNPRPTLSHEEPSADPSTPPVVTSSPAPDADPASVAFPYDEEGMWQEQFGSHSDAKRFGPSGVAADFSFPSASHVYGIPEHASSFSLHSTYGQKPGDYAEPYRLFNLDVFEYELNEPMALYGAVPFLLAHHRKATTGLLWLNSAETFIDIQHSTEGAGLLSSGTPSAHTHWMSESGIVDTFLLPGPTPSAVFSQYAQLTGLPALPRYFAIAYHQCRWNYKSEEDVQQVDAGFDEHDIPYDVIWLDIEHTDGKKYFTWDGHNFPHPLEMQALVAGKGRQLVTIVDPHMKRDTNWAVHTNALDKGYYVKTSSDGVYEGWCWPGSVSYLDFLDPTVRQYWADQFALDRYIGSSQHLFVWNDMNEPSVFNGPEVTMPKDCRHLHSSVEHRDVHNLYGHFNLLSTAQGLRQRDGKRPFVLSRSFFAGSQKHAAVWTGDNAAEWSHLAIATPMLLSLGVAGITFAGADVGGFFKDPDAELLTRWYQAGAWHPFYRGHAHIDTKRREPWLFGEPYTSHIRRAIKTRYALLPYLYTLFYIAHTTGVPVMRPLWVEFPHDEAVYAEEAQFMLGSAFLIAPVTQAGATSVSVYLPAGVWYDAHSLRSASAGSRSAPVTLDAIPVYLRGGSVVVRKDRARRSSSLMRFDPFTVLIALDAALSAEGTVFLDDGESFAYEQGGFAHRRLTVRGGREIRCEEAGKPTGASPYRSDALIERIVLLGLATDAERVTVQVEGEGQRRTVEGSRAKDGTFVLRKPQLRLTDAWTITLA